jgi:hypothetical protein
MKKKIKIGYDDIKIQKVDFTPQKQNDALGEFKASSSVIEIAKGMTQDRRPTPFYMKFYTDVCIKLV